MTSNITNLRQLEKVSLRERVSRALRAAIVSGELDPGQVYSAPGLGAKFGVSATPVREAMLDLVRENLVTTVPNKGYRVTTMDEADLDDITELRMLVEPAVTAQITPDVPAEDMPELRAMAQAIVDGALAGDLVAYTEADRVFHLKLLEYAGNRRITALISDLRAHTRLYGLAALAREQLEVSASTTRSSTPSRGASRTRSRSSCAHTSARCAVPGRTPSPRSATESLLRRIPASGGGFELSQHIAGRSVHLLLP